MTIARLYRLEAADAKAAELETALTALAQEVRSIPGCLGVELLRDAGDGGQFTFIEKWTSIEAHKTAGAQLPKDVFTPVMAASAGAPEGFYYDCLVEI